MDKNSSELPEYKMVSAVSSLWLVSWPELGDMLLFSFDVVMTAYILEGTLRSSLGDSCALGWVGKNHHRNKVNATFFYNSDSFMLVLIDIIYITQWLP